MPEIVRTHRGVIYTYTLDEAAAFLGGISPRTVRRYIQSGRLPAQKIRGRWIITEDNLTAFIRGAKTTHSRNTVPAPRFDESFPPDPFFSMDEQPI